ncbi:MAG: hypothetical protein MUE60_16410, partial [Candidatus Eisenbacteria bacterium]|nr:hypothetical protein [Candidatus Eisenbacteria bacterium]
QDLDTLTDPTDQSSVFVSSFCPTNALDDGAWSSAELTGGELRVLKEELPTELGPGTAGCSGLESVTYEYSTAVVNRPWFAPEAFEARFWRFTDPTVMLSDGRAPASGICPAYATAVVFVRNVRMRRRSGSGTPLPRPYFIGPVRAPGGVKAFLRQPHTPGMEAPNPMGARQALLKRAAARAPGNPLLGRHAAGARVGVTPVTKDGPTGGTVPGVRRIDASRLRRLQGKGFARRALVMVPSTSAPAGDHAPDAESEPDEGLVHILAFICTRLPLCPNPEPTLQWELS